MVLLFASLSDTNDGNVNLAIGTTDPQRLLERQR